MGQFDEYDSSEESGQEFPSDLEVSDEEGEADGDAPKAPKANGKAATTAAGTKRKAPPRDPKKGAKRREWLFCVLKSIRSDGAQDRRWMWSTRWRRSRCRGRCSGIGDPASSYLPSRLHDKSTCLHERPYASAGHISHHSSSDSSELSSS